MYRPSIPEPLKRGVYLEAGHRCAIPTCRQTPVEIAHIVPFAEVVEHKFENLIALCPTCHSRYDRREIDRKSMLQYKANLALLNSRYSDYERRLLEDFAEHPERTAFSINSGMNILVSYLVKDGVIVQEGGFVPTIDAQGLQSYNTYRLTEKGRIFVEKVKTAKQLDETSAES